jgi:hypothetical protein
MRHTLAALAVILAAPPARAQAPDSVAWERFFPAEIGDTWTYRHQTYSTQTGWVERLPLRVTVSGDSLVDGTALPVFTVELDTTRWTVVRGIADGDTWFTTTGSNGEWTSPWILVQQPNPLAPRFVFTNDEAPAPVSIQVGASVVPVDAVKGFSGAPYSVSVVQRFAADVGYYYLDYYNGVGSGGGHWGRRLELSYARVGGIVYGAPVAGEPEPAAAGGIALSLVPNPVLEAATFTLVLPQSSLVWLEVVDLLGRSVLARDLGEQPAGSSEHALNVSALAPGVYVLRATTDSGVVARRFVRTD